MQLCLMKQQESGHQNVQFADAQSEFEDLVLEVYRSIEKALGKKR